MRRQRQVPSRGKLSLGLDSLTAIGAQFACVSPYTNCLKAAKGLQGPVIVVLLPPDTRYFGLSKVSLVSRVNPRFSRGSTTQVRASSSNSCESPGNWRSNSQIIAKPHSAIAP